MNQPDHNAHPAIRRPVAVPPFPASRLEEDRLTDADRAELFARWPKGDVLEVETATSTQFNCFLAADEGDDERFMFWRETDGQYLCQDARSGQMMKGATLAVVMPAKRGFLNAD